MAQFARPDADGAFSGSWKDQADGTASLYATLDESSANDADYVYISSPSAGSFYEVGLSDVTDPSSSAGHVVRYRHHKNSSGGRQIDVTVELREGAAVRASWSHTAISDVVSTVSQTLTGTQADSITNYSNLSLRFSPVVVGGGPGREYRVTWAAVEVPDAGTPPALPGQSSESDSATVVSRRKLASSAQASELDSAGAVTRRKSSSAGSGVSLETAAAMGRVKRLSLEAAVESDSAAGVTVPAPVVLGAAVELVSATPVVRARLSAVSAAVELDSPGGRLGREKSTGFGRAVEADTASVVVSGQPVVVGPAVESVSVPAVGRSKALAVVASSESGSASAVSRVKSASVLGAAETDSGAGFARVKAATLGSAGSGESAGVLATSAGPILVGRAVELSFAGVLARAKTVTVTESAETDSAAVVEGPGAGPRRRVVGTLAVVGRLEGSATVTGRLEGRHDQVDGSLVTSGRVEGSVSAAGRVEGSVSVAALSGSTESNGVGGSVDYF